MKMETVIRSPQDGVIKKLAHKEGVSAPHPAGLLYYVDTDFTSGYLQGWNCSGTIRGGGVTGERGLIVFSILRNIGVMPLGIRAWAYECNEGLQGCIIPYIYTDPFMKELTDHGDLHRAF